MIRANRFISAPGFQTSVEGGLGHDSLLLQRIARPLVLAVIFLSLAACARGAEGNAANYATSAMPRLEVDDPSTEHVVVIVEATPTRTARATVLEDPTSIENTPAAPTATLADSAETPIPAVASRPIVVPARGSSPDPSRPVSPTHEVEAGLASALELAQVSPAVVALSEGVTEPAPTLDSEDVPSPPDSTIEKARPANPDRIRIPAARVNAPMVALGVKQNGMMEEPSRPDVVAWYTFGAMPGEGSNVVVAGHVDWKNSTAVFWWIRYLRLGDEITIETEDGAEHQYEVTDTVVYPASQAPVEDIVGPTAEEVVTIITCEGTFRNGDYSHRRVVRARRV